MCEKSAQIRELMRNNKIKLADTCLGKDMMNIKIPIGSYLFGNSF